jgi:hypothetical protein
MPRNNSTVGSVLGLLVFLGISAFFLFGGGFFSFFSFFTIVPIIFICIIFGIVAAAVSHSRGPAVNTARNNNYSQYYSQEAPKSNPYVSKPSSSYTVRPIYIEDEEPEKSTANFCQYCGTKKDRNAKYCYNCGTKLQ